MHPKFILHGNDSKFGTAFDRGAENIGIAVLKVAFRAPRTNSVCERFLGSVLRECLDHMLIFGERQPHRLLREDISYFNCARPPQGLNWQNPAELQKDVSAPTVSQQSRLGLVGL